MKYSAETIPRVTKNLPASKLRLVNVTNVVSLTMFPHGGLLLSHTGLMLLATHAIKTDYKMKKERKGLRDRLEKMTK